MDPGGDDPRAKPEQAHGLVHPGLPCPIQRGHAGDDGVLAGVLPVSGCGPYNGKQRSKQHGAQAEAPGASCGAVRAQALAARAPFRLRPRRGCGRTLILNKPWSHFKNCAILRSLRGSSMRRAISSKRQVL